jgi:hypothetical protein
MAYGCRDKTFQFDSTSMIFQGLKNVIGQATTIGRTETAEDEVLVL